jgi:hypothetical protein
MLEAPEPLEPPSGRPETPKNRTLEWFSENPALGLIGFVVGVVSLTATFYFGLVSLKTRDLSFTVNPTKTTIVKAGQSSDLHVLYKGQSVSTDVTALQLEIWNAGKESIRSEHILSPIILQTSPKVPILEVRLRHTTRPVCGIYLDELRLADGEVRVAWKILEHNDGAVVQLIVAGPSNVTVVSQGSVEGDPTVRLVTARSPLWLVDAAKLLMVLALWIWMAISLIRMPRPRGSVYILIWMLMTLCLALAFAVALTSFGSVPPPLSFD